jgi:hypothetical protein
LLREQPLIPYYVTTKFPHYEESRVYNCGLHVAIPTVVIPTVILFPGTSTSKAHDAYFPTPLPDSGDRGFFPAKCLTFYIAGVCFTEFKTAETDLFRCRILLPHPFRFWLLSTSVKTHITSCLIIIDWTPMHGYFDGCCCDFRVGYSSHGQARINAARKKMGHARWKYLIN